MDHHPRSRSCRSYRRPSYRQLQEENERFRKGFAYAVQLDERLRSLNTDKTLAGVPYLHKTLRPLAEAVEDYNSAGPLFEDSDEHGEECEGVCCV